MDDHELRSMLEREARLVPMSHDAPEALSAIGPALRRVAIKRASIAVASAVLLAGGTAAAINAAQPTDEAISIDSPIVAGPTVPVTTVDITVATTHATDDPGQSEREHTNSPSPVEVSDEAADPAPPSSSVALLPVPDTTVLDQASPPSTGAPTTAPAGDDSTTTTSAAPPATTVPAPGVTTYDSPCGTVVADLATSPPTLIEIVPADGYRYTVEDPEHDRVTVHLTGGGEDCEIKIGEPPIDDDPDTATPVDDDAD